MNGINFVYILTYMNVSFFIVNDKNTIQHLLEDIKFLVLLFVVCASWICSGIGHTIRTSLNIEKVQKLS